MPPTTEPQGFVSAPEQGDKLDLRAYWTIISVLAVGEARPGSAG